MSAITLALEYLKLAKQYGPPMAFGNTTIDDAIAGLEAGTGEPVAWAVYAKVEDGSWQIQYPVRFTEADAKADFQMYEKTTQLRVIPLYTAPPPAVPQWLPIESAPKDGTAILLGSRCGAWIGKWKPIYTSGYQPENPWSSLMLNHDHMAEKWQTPTHFMPLPTAPGAPA